ncbi:MAG: T9SS type A sorting domain-containing protein [Sphingobacteriales bacterium]|nr:T9SS type A sorting domain-containing protein [Sphingobacteriales bacterium]
MYFYHTDPLYTPAVNARLVPKCDAASACTPVNNFIVTNTIPSAGWAYTGCLDLNGDGIAGMAAPNPDDCQTKECYYAAKAYLNNLKNEIDGGDKADLLNSLYNSPEALATYQKYMAASPYLSDEVLITAAQTDLMSPNHRANILLSNAPLSDEAMYQIQDLVAENVYQLLYTIKYYTKFSARDNLNLSISRESAKKEELLHNLLQKFADEKDYAQLDEVLTAENTTYAVRALLSSKAERGQYANAQAMLNYLPATNPDEQDYKTIQQINLQRLSATAEGFELSEEQYQQLRTIALAYGTQAPYAQTLLGLLRGEYFDWTIPEDDTESGKTNTHPRYKDVALLGKSVLNRLVATPNPANYTVNVQLPAYFTENSANLSLYDTHGKQLKSWTIDKEQASIDIHIDDLPNGIYLLNYTTDGTTLANTKLVIQH